jgi:hypothetical protein
MQYIFTSFHFYCYERQNNGSIPIRRQCQPGRSAPMHFSPSFSIGQNQCPPEQDLWVSATHGLTIIEALERLQDYIAACPHHGMKEWFIIQSFYHELICSSREHIDVAAGGTFFALSIEEAHKLVEKMASNQSWNEQRTQTCTRKVHQLEEVDMLTAMIDLLLKKLENPGRDHVKMVDARVMCEECGETCHMGINCPTMPQVVNKVGNFNNGFCPNQGFNARWNKPNFPFYNRQQGGNG